MELPLVVGVDGSDGSLLAVDRAVDAAARLGIRLGRGAHTLPHHADRPVAVVAQPV